MGVCSDKSTKFLANKGYNVVRHPSVEYRPLMLLGRQNKEVLQLGPLDLLVTNPPGPLPQIAADQPAADLNGNASDKLAVGVGINILGNIIGAMGGNLGATVNFTKAKRMEFSYRDVLNDSVLPLNVGNYLKNAEVDAANLVLREYVLGNGELFLITKTAKSNVFTVKFESSSGTAVGVDVPVIQQLVGGNVKVEASGENNSVVSFEGKTRLAFAFQCFQLGVLDGVLALTSVQAGAVTAAAGAAGESKPEALAAASLLDVRRRAGVTPALSRRQPARIESPDRWTTATSPTRPDSSMRLKATRFAWVGWSARRPRPTN